MVSLSNIYSLTDFRHNAKKFVEEMQSTKAPIVLTVNGRAAVVMEDVSTFEARQNRIRELEDEVQALKFAALKEAVRLGVEQADQGKFSTRSPDEIIASARNAVSPGEDS